MTDYDPRSIAYDPVFQLAYLSCVLSNKDSNRPVFESTVLGEMARLRDFTSPDSMISRAEKASSFVAVIDSIEFEESSQRYLITMTPTGTGEPETIRTDRVDSRYGNYVRSFWGRKALVGHKCVIYKYLENAGTDPKARQGFRVCPYARIIS